MFRRVRLSIIRSLLTVNSAKLHVIQVCREPFEQQLTIAECTVNKILMMDRGTVQNM